MRYMLLLLLLFSTLSTYAQPKVILDADIDSDVDDVAALAMLHKLASEKRIQLIGIVVTSDDPYAPTCVDAINHYFGRKDIPISFLKKQTTLKNHSKYTRQISNEFPHSLKTFEDAWESADLYRKLLAESADRSVTIITIGHLSSLQALFQSSPDKYSQLGGLELASKKVRQWICMGGMFPSGKEANFYRPDPASTIYCLQQWTGPVTFCGWEVGNLIISGGADLKESIPTESPVHRGFELYNNFAGRPSWDQVAILMLAPESIQFFEPVSDGRCDVAPDGSNTWIKGSKSNHSYVTLKKGVNPETIARLINSMVVK